MIANFIRDRWNVRSTHVQLCNVFEKIVSGPKSDFLGCILPNLNWGSPRGKRNGVIGHISERENGNWMIMNHYIV